MIKALLAELLLLRREERQGCFKWEQNHFPISSALAEKVKWFLFVFFSLQNNFSLLGRVESERIPSCYEVLWIRKVGRGLSGDSSKGRGQLDPKPFQGSRIHVAGTL